MLIPFKYYLHDDSGLYEREDELTKQDSRITPELVEKMGRPFYEVTLECLADSETGNVTIVSARL